MMTDQFFTIDEMIQITKGNLIQKQDSFIYGVSTDSRTIQKGDLFIPLKGENFDGHDYLEEVTKKGAACALISKDIQSSLPISLIKVDDTLKALQDLASYYRKNHEFKIIGITGSNGKTTTKFFAEKILSQKYRTYASQKSFNNHIGVPLTLLALKPDTEIGIVEIGMNHPGEIAALTKLADPDISLVTSVGRAHLMDFNGVDGIAREKSEIYNQSRSDSIKIFNLDNELTFKMFDAIQDKERTLTFSSERKNSHIHFELKEMKLESLRITGTINGIEGDIVVPIFGAHNVTNLMAASAIALAVGMKPEEIWTALPNCQTVWGRNMLVNLKSHAKLIFDGYNANPDSMKALIDNLSQIKNEGKKIIILGDMLEMGSEGESLHRELGELVGSKNFDIVWFLGQFSKAFEEGIRSVGFSNSLFISNGYEESLAVKVASMIEPSDIVVMKGSRGAKLEKLVSHFEPINWI